jgi:membrane protein
MEQLEKRLLALLWPAEMPANPGHRALLIVGRYTMALLRDFASGALSLRATGLVYTTMLAIVPLLALSFSVLKGFGFHHRMEPLLLNLLAPLGPRSEELTASVIGFVDNVQGSALAGVSLALLIFTALQMAQRVEDGFNFVWRVDRPRSFARRFSEYLSVMLVGPVIMTIAMGLTATVASTTVIERLQQVEPFGSLIVSLGQMMPYLLVIAAFTFLYAFVPNTTVRVRSALLGGLLAGSLWAATGELFAEFVAGASRTEAIYSGFAIVIVAMLWLYVSWLILLLGAQFTFYHQNPDYLSLGRATPTMSNGLREKLAIAVMLLIATDFERPSHGWRVPGLAAKLGMPRHLLEPIVNALRQAELVAETTEQRLVPTKDLRRISLAEILDAVRGSLGDPSATLGIPWNATVASLSEKIGSSIQSALQDRSLADLVDEDEKRRPATT